MNLYLNFLNMQKKQLNLSTTATLRTEKRRWGGGGGEYKELAVVERIKQESMYGLFVRLDKKVPVVEIRRPLH